MFVKTAIAVAATLTLGILANAASGDELARPKAQSVPAQADVYQPISGMTYAVGSNGFLGYFRQAAGKCALTLMLFETTDGNGGVPDSSAAQVQVSIPPGDKVKIASAEGENLMLNCDADAQTVSVSRSAGQLPNF